MRHTSFLHNAQTYCTSVFTFTSACVSVSLFSGGLSSNAQIVNMRFSRRPSPLLIPNHHCHPNPLSQTPTASPHHWPGLKQINHRGGPGPGSQKAAVSFKKIFKQPRRREALSVWVWERRCVLTWFYNDGTGVPEHTPGSDSNKNSL